MYLCVLIIVSSVIVAHGGWVEIPQISTSSRTKVTTDGLLEPPNIVSVTTPSTYKMLMTTPTITMAPVTTSQRFNEPTPSPEGLTSSFLPFLNEVQASLTKNSKKSLRSKIKLLTDLRDNLLANIDDKMGSLWSSSREARSHDDHEMEFPSNEGALMTIGFLTFAVFLIKLVLKLVVSLKHKANNGMTTANGVTTTVIGRRKRELENDSQKILQLIEEYKFS